MLGSDMAALHEFIDPAALPPSLGGTCESPQVRMRADQGRTVGRTLLTLLDAAELV